MKIDEFLADPLSQLPDGTASAITASVGMSHLNRNLAFRNLRRSQAFNLPSGEQVARAFGEPVVQLQPPRVVGLSLDVEL